VLSSLRLRLHRLAVTRWSVEGHPAKKASGKSYLLEWGFRGLFDGCLFGCREIEQALIQPKNT
jgi:hypothetical protein